MEKLLNHYEETSLISASPKVIYDYADDHARFSSHMNKSSWMMGGGKMETKVDEGQGKKVGSHITMTGKVFGIGLSLDEIVTQHDPPKRKVWETVGNPKLLVIGPYQLGLELKPVNEETNLKVFIDYSLPQSFSTRLLGHLFGRMYAKCCVRQMVEGVRDQFIKK